MKKIIIAFIALAGVACPLMAQWNTDPAVNTFVAGSQEDRLYPQIAITPQGNFFVSNWHAVPDTNINFNMWLQLVDANGYPKWGTDGIQISRNPSRSWISYYGMAVDTAGRAVIAIEDYHGNTGHSHVSIYSRDQNGHPVWDSAGIQLYYGDNDSYSPNIGLTRKNNSIVTWIVNLAVNDQEKNFILFGKYSPTGEALWSNPKGIPGDDSTTMFSWVTPVGQDDFILFWLHKYYVHSGMGGMWYTYILAQRYDPDGNTVWPQPARICDLGDSANRVVGFLRLTPVVDPDDGVYIAWFDDRYQTDYFNIYIQHVDVNGNLRWAQNGIPVSPYNEGFNRYEPYIALDTLNGQLTVFWSEDRDVGIYLASGICGQKFDPAGNLLWGDSTRIIRPFSLDSSYFAMYADIIPPHDTYLQFAATIDSIIGPDTILISQLFGTRLNSDGIPQWSPPIKGISLTAAAKYHPMTISAPGLMHVTAWSENRDSLFASYGSIYVQNILYDGNIGPVGVKEPAVPANSARIYPNPATKDAWLRCDLEGLAVITILGLNGQPVAELGTVHLSPGQPFRIGTGDLRPGLYLVRITTAEKTVTLKLITAL